MAKPTPPSSPSRGNPSVGPNTPATDAKSPGRLSWFVGWVAVPGAVMGALFGGGVLLGAHRPDGWFARAVMWVAGLF